jgi:hypothetical protein
MKARCREVLRFIPLHIVVVLLASSTLFSVLGSADMLGIGTLLQLGSIFFAAGFSLVSLVRAIAEFFKKKWYPACRYLMFSIFAITLILPCCRLGDYIHVVLFSPYYVFKIAQMDSFSKEVRFPWGDYALTVLDGSIPRTLVYDPSGSREKETVPIKLELGTRYTRHVIGPFYLEDIITND